MEFNQLAAANSKDASDMLNRVMTKDNIGIVALLETNDNYSFGSDASSAHRQVIVSNVHMAWEPEYSDVKLIQTVLLMQFLQNFRQEIDSNNLPAGNYVLNVLYNYWNHLSSDDQWDVLTSIELHGLGW